MSSLPTSAQQNTESKQNPDGNHELTVHCDEMSHGQYPTQQNTSQSIKSSTSSESGSLYEIQPVRREHQVHSELRGTGDGILTPQISRISCNSLAGRIPTTGTTGTTDPSFEVDWDGEDDTENPWNWSLPYTAMCIAFLSYNTLVM